VATPLAAGDVVKVYANGNLLGNATVNSAGTAWAITDPNGYNANWVYSANIVSGGVTSSTATQPVRTDLTEAAPVITSVIDSASVSVANAGTTANSIATVSGTGAPGDVLFLFDNSSSNLVASTVVAANGTWSVSGSGIGLGSNTLAARQYDLMGNPSGFSNLWTVNSSGLNLVPNGDFNNTANYTTSLPYTTAAHDYTAYLYNTLAVGTPAGNMLALSPSSTSTATTIGGSNISWATNSVTVPRSSPLGDFVATRASIFGPDNAMQGSVTGSQGLTDLYKSGTFNVVKGQTYTFSFNYYSDDWRVKALTAVVDGVEMAVPVRVGAGETVVTTGKFTATYVANESKSINITMVGNNQGNGGLGGDFWLDDINFQLVTPSNNNSLVAGGTSPASSGSDTVTLIGGVAAPLAGDDTILADSDLQAKLAAGGLINGGAGVDTLRLAAGTNLNLDTLGGNQTVKPIQEVEVFELQGNSSLKLSANDVLSLGGSNASTMSAYSFASTTQSTFGSTVATGTTSSTGKVQFVVNGTSSDVVSLDALGLDNVSTNGTVGNTGLAGQWDYKGTTDIAVGGVTTTYRVYNHSTTSAQVLVDNEVAGNRVTIAQAESSAKTYTEEFESVTNNSGVFQTAGWTISQVDTATGVSAGGLAIQGGGSNYPGVGTDGHIFVNPGNTQSAVNRTLVFDSKLGSFTGISFIHADLQGPQGPLPIKFYNAAGVEVASTTLSTFGQGATFSYTLPAGVSATSFKIFTNYNDLWVIDTMVATVGSGTPLTSGSGSIDTTPLLRGTYEGKLNAGDVIKVYDGATELGNATVDPATMTWSYQVGTAASIGNHTYSAKIVGSGSQQLATSSNFTLNILASPLVLDMNGDGVQTLGIEEGVQFDLLNTGTAQQVGWVDKHDGLLVIDLNQDGVINTGAELFGSSTALTQGGLAEDGWLALAQYDLDTDGRIDAKDAIFKDLQVWVDTNSNGVSEAGELRSLADAGVQSINLQHDNTQITQNGNVLQGFSSFTTTDGQSHQIVDAWLQTTVAAMAPTFNLVNAKEDTLNLNLADVFKTAANSAGLQVVQVNGEATDTVNLSNLLDTGEAQGGWQASGVVVKTGVTYNAYSHSADASLQVLIDQNITQVNIG